MKSKLKILNILKYVGLTVLAIGMFIFYSVFMKAVMEFKLR